MLIYHPASDAYHCVFRMLLIANTVSAPEVDKARLLDYYLTFPSEVAAIRMPPGTNGVRQQANAFRNPYRDPVSARSAFRDLRHVQEAALRCLTASGHLDRGAMEAGFVVRGDAGLAEDLATHLAGYRADREPVATFILEDLAAWPLLGANGIKDRSRLMEHRYDVA